MEKKKKAIEIGFYKVNGNNIMMNVVAETLEKTRKQKWQRFVFVFLDRLRFCSVSVRVLHEPLF